MVNDTNTAEYMNLILSTVKIPLLNLNNLIEKIANENNMCD